MTVSTRNSLNQGSTGQPLGHIAELDGLRGLAVIGVLFFHADHLRGGFLGVDLFFVLSGWLITRLLLIETAQTGNVALGAFWGRRLRRLLPAVLALLVAVSAYAWWAGDTAARVDTTSSGPWAQWYVANWHMISGAGDYWASFSEPSMFGHLWSLAIEEQFYVVWPLVIAALWRLARNPLRAAQATTTVAIVASTTAAIVLATTSGATRVYMGTDTRAASILCGALAAMPLASRLWARMMSTRLGDAVVAACGVAVTAMWWFVDGTASEWLFRGGLTVHAAACAVVIGGVVARRDSTRRRSVVAACLSTPLLQRSGQLSYSLYLWHWPVYIVVADRTDLDGWALTGVRLGATTAVAVAGYVMVEQYVRRRARWAHGRRGVAATTVAMAAVSIWWVAVPAPTRTIAGLDASRVLAPAPSTSIDVRPATTAPVQRPSDSTSTSSVANPTPTSTTVFATTTAVPTTTTIPPVKLLDVVEVLWHGDSVAHDAAPAITAAFDAMGVGVLDLSYPGSRLTELPNGDNPLERIADAATAGRPDLVIHQLTTWDTLASPIDQRRAISDLVDIAESIGATVVIITSPVEAAAVVEQVDIDRHLAIVRQVLSAADTPSVIWDQSDVFGTTFTVDIDNDGIPERKRDGVHLCPSGAARFAVWLVNQITSISRLDAPDHSTWLSLPWADDDRYDDPPGACEPLSVAG